MFCPKCGTKCADDDNFCISCGTSFVARKISIDPAVRLVEPVRRIETQPTYQVVDKPNSFMAEPEKDKLKIGLLCANIVLLIAAIALIAVIVTAGVSSAETTVEGEGGKKISSEPKTLVGVWVYANNYDGYEMEKTFFVFCADGSGEAVQVYEGGYYNEDISWYHYDDIFAMTRYFDDGESYEIEYEYKIEGKYLYLVSPLDNYQKLPLCFISADTSISYDEIDEKFSEMEDGYFEVFDECMKENYNTYDDEYYDEYYDDEGDYVADDVLSYADAY